MGNLNDLKNVVKSFLSGSTGVCSKVVVLFSTLPFFVCKATFILIASASIVYCSFRWALKFKDFFYIMSLQRLSTLLSLCKFCSVANLIFKFLRFLTGMNFN